MFVLYSVVFVGFTVYCFVEFLRFFLAVVT